MTLILGVTVQAAISEAGGSASVRLLDSTKTTLSGGHPVIRPQMSRAVACWSQSTEQQLKLQSSYEKTQTTTRDFLMFAQSAFFSFIINPAIKCGPVVVSFKQPVISVVNKRHEVLFSSCIMCDVVVVRSKAINHLHRAVVLMSTVGLSSLFSFIL